MTETTRVAVRAIARAPRYNGGTLSRWAIVDIPTGLVGHRTDERDAIVAALPVDYTGFVGEVIIAEGFGAGCSTWLHHRDGQHAQAPAEHRDCEHTLFGGTPADGWTRVTDPDELDACAAMERWSFDSVDWRMIVQRPRRDPGRWYLTIRRDEWGVLEDLENWALSEEYDIDDAKRSATQTVVEAIGGL